eukprot:GHVR01023615.1.p1 GENE.GHVR01023615.1~~GHVR01023615.1.p1  ORF type:complete len:324 (+),score=48.30 GHVR01023615.1:53-1024(+)
MSANVLVEYTPSLRAGLVVKGLLDAAKGSAYAVIAWKFIMLPLYTIFWNTFYNSMPESYFFVLAVTCVLGSVSSFMVFFFFTCDQLGWLQKYKMPRTKRMTLSKKLYIKGFLVFGLNVFILGPLYLLFVFYPVFKYFGLSLDPREINLKLSSSALFYCWLDFFLSDLTCEFTFYFFHVIVHTNPIYKWVHKQHHSFVGTVALAGRYAHPAEDFLANLTPGFLFFLLRGHNLSYLLTWLVWRTEETYESHCGYCFLGTVLSRVGLLNGKKAANHDYHHTQVMQNYGVGLIADAIFGTNRRFFERFGGPERYARGDYPRTADKAE